MIRAYKHNAIPAWADYLKIKEKYDLAAQFRLFGVEMQVDHIVPITGKTIHEGKHIHTVCGLHVADNLQTIHKQLNFTKGPYYCDDWA